MVQDASFITSDPGHAGADKPRGEEAKTRRSRDGAWVKKGDKSVFGYKLHMKMDLDHGLIRELEASVASAHDSRVDLSLSVRWFTGIKGTRVLCPVATTRRGRGLGGVIRYVSGIGSGTGV